MPNSNTSHAECLLVQLSDTHLCASTSARLRGVVTLDCLEAVLSLAAEPLAAADAAVVTGDISHDGSRASYGLLAERLHPLRTSSHFLPGNHDRPAEMDALHPPVPWPWVQPLGAWRLVGLTSHRPEREDGRLGPPQLDALDELLRSGSQWHTVVALHHPPIPTGSPWLDRIGLEDHEALHDIVARHTQVRAVIFGHAHQEIDRLEQGVRWMCCPATCVQFLPDCEKPYSDTRLPGFRWLRLHHDGTLETGIERLTAWPPGSEPEGIRDD